jgi:hypothetical protein
MYSALYTNRRSCSCRCRRATGSCSYPAYGGGQGRQGRSAAAGGRGRGPAAGGRDSPRTATAPSAQRRSSSGPRAWPGAPSGGGILGHQFEKRLESFAPCYIHSVSILTDFKRKADSILCTGFKNTSKKKSAKREISFCRKEK